MNSMQVLLLFSQTRSQVATHVVLDCCDVSRLFSLSLYSYLHSLLKHSYTASSKVSNVNNKHCSLAAYELLLLLVVGQ